MDQVLIGKFIAKERKRKGYTQKQLSEKIGISDKTVSKWERGNGFPEVSLLLPLCNELDITVNELLSGERVSEEDYRKKAEENMVNMIKEREENKKKTILTVVTGLISITSFLTLLMVVCMYTDVIALPVKIVLVGIACAIFFVGLIVAMEGERTIGYYKCSKCDALYVPSFPSYFMGAHFITKRYMRCPRCGKMNWSKKVLSKEKMQKK